MTTRPELQVIISLVVLRAGGGGEGEGEGERDGEEPKHWHQLLSSGMMIPT
jgi:hypothetical protein